MRASVGNLVQAIRSMLHRRLGISTAPAKGNILVVYGTTGSDFEVGWLPVGATPDGYVVTRDSTADAGVSWAAPGGGGGGAVADADYGDIVVSGIGTIWTIDSNVVSNSKFRQSVANSVVGRATGSTGNVADIQATTTWSFLGFNGTSLSFLVPDHANLASLLWTSSGHLGTGAAPQIAAFNSSNAAALYTVTGSGTVVALATSPSLASPTFSSYTAWTDQSANAGNAGRLQRNGANLSWHNGTAAKDLAQITGQLGGSGDSPTVLGIRETGGPTSLTNGAIPDGAILQRSGTSLIGTLLSVLLAHLALDQFGDGRDGSVTLVGTTTISRDEFYDTLDMNGQTLGGAGWRVRVATELKGTGTIHNSASGVTGGGTGSTIGGGGGSGGVANGGGASSGAVGNCWSRLNGTGGTGQGGNGGGDGSTHAGGSGGATTAPSSTLGGESATTYDTGILFGQSGPATALRGGSGGGSGGSGSGSTSGSSGAGGGLMIVHARRITGTISVEAKGSPAGAPSGTNAGGSAGGGGGTVIVRWAEKTGTVTTDVSGGAKSAPIGTGIAAQDGAAGYASARGIVV